MPAAFVALAAFSGTSARAESFTFSAADFAQATITTGTNTVTVQLTDLVVNPAAVTSNLSAFIFTLGGPFASGSAPTSAYLTDSSSREVTIGGPDYTMGPEVSPGWVVSLTHSTTKMDVLAGPDHAGPAETIVGVPGPGGYTNANGSLTNGAHNPFLYETATWTLTEMGVTGNTTVTGAIFQGGTTDGSNQFAGTLTSQINSGLAAPAPEPSTIGMVASAVILLGLSRLRRRT
jgi:hypothetical protein